MRPGAITRKDPGRAGAFHTKRLRRPRSEELIVDSGTHDVIPFVDGTDGVTLAAKINVQVFCPHAPPRRKLPLHAGTDRPSDRHIGAPERPDTGGRDASRAGPASRNFGFTVGETAGSIPQQVDG